MVAPDLKHDVFIIASHLGSNLCKKKKPQIWHNERIWQLCPLKLATLSVCYDQILWQWILFAQYHGLKP